jgi:hypothetical protein
MLRLGGIAAAGAAAAAVASVIDASPAAAGTDGDVVLGGNGNITTTATGIEVTGTAAAYGFGVTDNGVASLHGITPAILGHANGQNFNSAVYALSTGGFYGVRAEHFGTEGAAVYAATSATATSGAAIIGESAGIGPALEGQTTSATNTFAVLDARSSSKGGALYALTGSIAVAPAVLATSGSAQPALKGVGKSVPVGAAVPIAGNAAALAVQGVATFTRSGVTALTTAGSSILVSVPGGLTATSHVLATLQGTFAGNVAVKSVAPNTATGKITIYFTAAVPVGAKVAWFVFG